MFFNKIRNFSLFLCFVACSLKASVNRWDYVTERVQLVMFGSEMAKMPLSKLSQSKTFPEIEAQLIKEERNYLTFEGVKRSLKELAQFLFNDGVKAVEKDIAQATWCKSFQDVEDFIQATPMKKALHLLIYADIVNAYFQGESRILAKDKPTDISRKFGKLPDDAIMEYCRFVFRKEPQRFILESIRGLSRGYILVPIPALNDRDFEGESSFFLSSMRLSILKIFFTHDRYWVKAEQIEKGFAQRFAQHAFDVLRENWSCAGAELALSTFYMTQGYLNFIADKHKFCRIQHKAYFKEVQDTLDVESIDIQKIIDDLTINDQVHLSYNALMLGWIQKLVRRIWDKISPRELSL